MRGGTCEVEGCGRRQIYRWTSAFCRGHAEGVASGRSGITARQSAFIEKVLAKLNVSWSEAWGYVVELGAKAVHGNSIAAYAFRAHQVGVRRPEQLSTWQADRFLRALNQYGLDLRKQEGGDPCP